MDYLTLAVVCFVLGMVLLAAEVLLPTGGVLVVASLLFFGLGVGVILYEGDTIEAVVALGGLAIGLPVAGMVMVSAYRRLSLGSALPEDGGSAGARDGVNESESLKNHTGKTVSPMRPSGSVEIDGRRIDAMTEGGMLEAGVWVRCVEVKGGKVIVRQIESPAGLADISPGAETPAGRPAPPPPIRPGAATGPSDDLDDLDLGLDR